MKKQPFDTWALDLLKKYQVHLGLQNYHPLQLEHKPDHPGAECQFYYPYSTITVRYGDVVKAEYDKGNLEYAKKVLVHELCHAITDPFYAKASTTYVSKSEIEDERERLTDHIANMVIKLTEV